MKVNAALLSVKSKPAAKVEQLLQKYFADSILPDKGFFKRQDAPLYVHQRSQSGGDPVDRVLRAQFHITEPDLALPIEYPFEAHIDTLFWGPTYKRYVYLVGEPGSGKSTFIDYYLRCYCFTSNSPPRDFLKKLIIQVNCRDIQTPDTLEEAFYKQAKEQICDAFIDRGMNIETDRNYVFWDVIAHFNSSQTKDLQSQLKLTDSAYRHSYHLSRTRSLTPKDWMECAFRYLSEQKDTFAYLVLVLDNLDQSPPEVQLHALHFLQALLRSNPKIDFYRIFLPFWPDSLNQIVQHSTRPQLVGEYVPLGPVDKELFLTARIAGFQRDIADGGLGAEPSDELDWTTSFFRDFRENVRGVIDSWINDLSGSCIRLKQAIYFELLCNTSIRRRYAKIALTDGASGVFRSIGRHAILTGLLVGRFSHWCHIHSPIINLFCIVQEDIGCRNLLCGSHLLQLLKSGKRDARDIRRELEDLGYSATAIDAGIQSFVKANIIQAHDTKRGVRRYRVYDNTLDAYWSMLTNSTYMGPYLEVMMVRSYVDCKRLPSMHDTGILDPAEFSNRIRTALQFLDQLCCDEGKFVDVACCPASIDPSTFRNALIRQRLHSTFRLVALAYLEHIRAARDISSLPASHSDWDEFERHNVFARARSWDRDLTPNG